MEGYSQEHLWKFQIKGYLVQTLQPLDPTWTTAHIHPICEPAEGIIARNLWLYPLPEQGSAYFSDFSMQAGLFLTVVLEGTIYIRNKKPYFTTLLKMPSGYSLS